MARKPIVEAPPRPASAERGEIMLKLDGADFVLRPSFEAIEAFEGSTGKGLLQLAREAVSGTLRVSEVAQIVCECVRAWGRATQQKSAAGVQARRVADLILEAEGGLSAALHTLGGMLALASTGGYTALGEMKAGTTTTSGAPAES